jgi:hypothetical protein
MTPLEKARRALAEWTPPEHGSYYERVVKPARLRAKVVTYEIAEEFGLTVNERSRLYVANRAMVEAGWSEQDLYRPAERLDNDELRILYGNYQMHGFSRREIFEMIPGMEESITGYTQLWDARRA